MTFWLLEVTCNSRSHSLSRYFRVKAVGPHRTFTMLALTTFNNPTCLHP